MKEKKARVEDALHATRAAVEEGVVAGGVYSACVPCGCLCCRGSENFGSGMVRVGSIRVSGPLSGEHISGVGSGMGPGRSVRVSMMEEAKDKEIFLRKMSKSVEEGDRR